MKDKVTFPKNEFWPRFEIVPSLLSIFLYLRKLQLSSFATIYDLLLEYPGKVVNSSGVHKNF